MPSTDRPEAHDVRTRRIALAVVLLVTLVSRVAYWPAGIVGKDGQCYINGMKLDSTYDVPPPGNVGWVLLGKAFHAVGFPSVDAFTAAGILVSVVGTAYFFLLCTLVMRPWMGAATTLAMALSPMVWYHSPTLMSYETWLCVPPAIAYYGVRYWRERRLGLLYASALATGLGTILRPDMVAFAGPLLGGVLLLGRAPIIRGWAVCAAICAGCCCVWFFTTAMAIGGIEQYLHIIRGQSEYIDTFSVKQKGAFEGLARNTAKFAMFFAWGAVFVSPFALFGLVRLLRNLRANWKVAALGVLALAPSLYFGIWLFMGNAGLALPAIGLAFLLAGFGLESALAARRPALPMWIVGIVGVIGALQFVATPILTQHDQRDVILNVSFFRYSGDGIRRLYGYNLVDFGVESSLAATLKQLRHPEPVPKTPPEMR